MPNAGDKVKISIAQNASDFASYVGVFAGYDTVTENYIIEDCYWTQAPDYKNKMFFNRRYVVMIEHI